MVVMGERAGVEEPGEAADAAHDLRTAGLGDPFLHELDGAVASLDVHPAAAYADCSLMGALSQSPTGQNLSTKFGARSDRR